MTPAIATGTPAVPTSPVTIPPTAQLDRSEPAKLKFSGSDRFIRELRHRVDAYFEQTGRRRRDCVQMYFKTATILAWFAAAYFLLMFVATSWWAIVPLAILIGLANGAIRLNIQHDRGPTADSNDRW